MPYAQNTIALSPNVFFNLNISVTGHSQWAVGSVQRNATHCLGLMQTPQTLCVHRMRKRTSTEANT